MEDFFNRLNITYFSEIKPYYERALELYKKMGNAILALDRILLLSSEYSLLKKYIKDISDAVAEVEKDKELTIFTYMLYEVLKHDEGVKNILPHLEMPDRGRLDTDWAPFFSLFFYAEDMIYDMEERGLPNDIVRDTLNDFEVKVGDYFERHGRTGLRDYVGWLSNFTRRKIITVGRFNFQMHHVTDDVKVYEKDGSYKIFMDNVEVHKKGMLFGSAGMDDEEGKYIATLTEGDGWVEGYKINEFGECTGEKEKIFGYRLALCKGDKVLNVHIPSHKPLDAETCEESYARARQIFKRYYPEFDYKAFACCSWMMEPRLKEILGRQTNITRFTDKYMTYPTKASGTAVYSFIFLQPPQKSYSYETMTENTSLERAVKRRYAEGGYVYEKCGVFF